MATPGIAEHGGRPGPEARGSFKSSYRVRFDEAGADGLARASTLLRLAQDMAWQHGSAVGLERSWYEIEGLAWLVRAVDLRLLDSIPAGADLDAVTSVSGYRRSWARRGVAFRVAGGGDGLAAEVWTDWVLVDRRGRLIRIPESFGARFQAASSEIELTRVRLDPAPADARRSVLRVRLHEVDPNGHVNNAVHLDWLDEAVAAAGGREAISTFPRRYRLEYVTPLPPDAAAAIVAWPSGRAWQAEMSGPGGGPVARALLEPGPGPG